MNEEREGATGPADRAPAGMTPLYEIQGEVALLQQRIAPADLPRAIECFRSAVAAGRAIDLAEAIGEVAGLSLQDVESIRERAKSEFVARRAQAPATAASQSAVPRSTSGVAEAPRPRRSWVAVGIVSIAALAATTMILKPWQVGSTPQHEEPRLADGDRAEHADAGDDGNQGPPTDLAVSEGTGHGASNAGSRDTGPGPGVHGPASESVAEKIPDPEIQVLAQRVRSEGDPYERERIFNLLAEHDSPTASGCLEAIYSDRDLSREIREEAVLALAWGYPLRCRDLLLGIVGQGTDAEDRQLAILALAPWVPRDPEVREIFLVRFGAARDDPEEAALVAAALAESGDPETREALQRAISGLPPATMEAVREALGPHD